MKIAPLAAAALLSVVTLARRRRLAAMAGPGSHAHLERNRPPEGMAGGAARRSCGRRRGLGSGYGSMAVAGDRVFVQGTRGRRQRRHRPESRGRQGSLVEGAGRVPDQRPGPRARAARRPSTAIACTCSPRTATWRA